MESVSSIGSAMSISASLEPAAVTPNRWKARALRYSHGSEKSASTNTTATTGGGGNLSQKSFSETNSPVDKEYDENNEGALGGTVVRKRSYSDPSMATAALSSSSKDAGDGKAFASFTGEDDSDNRRNDVGKPNQNHAGGGRSNSAYATAELRPEHRRNRDTSLTAVSSGGLGGDGDNNSNNNTTTAIRRQSSGSLVSAGTDDDFEGDGEG
jgi:hypothetical protein